MIKKEGDKLFKEILESWSSSKYSLFAHTFGKLGRLLPFAKHPENPVLTKGPSGAWDEGEVEPYNCFFGEDRRFWLYYHNDSATGVRGIGLAYSDDLVTWTKESDNPVLAPGSGWESRGVTHASILANYDRYHMIYEATDEDRHHAFGHATSPDGVNWNRDPANPVLDIPQDARGPWLVKAGDRYRLYYAMAAGSHRGCVGYAESENFTDWVHKGVAMKRNYASSSVTYRAVSHPKVLKTGGLWVMFYSGAKVAPPGWGNVELCMALSNDGTRFVKYPKNPVVTQDLQGPGTSRTGLIHPCPVIDKRGRLCLLYHWAGDQDNTALAVSTARGVDGYFKGTDGTVWNDASISAGDTTYGIPTFGYEKITIKFLSDTAGNLDVETQEPDLDWRILLNDQSISANDLEEINLSGLQRGIRLTFDTAATVTAFYQLK